MRKCYAILTVWMLCVPAVSAQGVFNSDSSILATAFELAIQKPNPDARKIFRGKEYFPYFGKMGEGHPFFLTQDFQFESIYYDGVLYSNVGLLYDAFRDEVVVANNHQQFLVPVKEAVNKFTLMGHSFRYIDDQKNLEVGYYDVLFDGKVSFVAKRMKLVKGFNWIDKVKYYMVGTDVKIVSSRNDVINALSDKEEAITRFIRSNKLSFSKDWENSVKKVLQFYSTL